MDLVDIILMVYSCTLLSYIFKKMIAFRSRNDALSENELKQSYSAKCIIEGSISRDFKKNLTRKLKEIYAGVVNNGSEDEHIRITSVGEDIRSLEIQVTARSEFLLACIIGEIMHLCKREGLICLVSSN